MENPFANVFLLVDNGSQSPTLQTAGSCDQPRKKRAHRKSRQGCTACKRRRVKCDEQVPCANCTRRNEKCVRPAQQKREPIPSSLSSPKFEASREPELNLLHFELFSHFEKHTLSTLSFPEVWPMLMQQAFHEETVMSAVLCVSAAHLACLNPRDSRYSRASAQLLPKALRLLRQSLSHPFTKQNVHALLGTSFLMSYISWSDLNFLNQQQSSDTKNSELDLSQDQLFLLSPGVLQVYFQALPILVAEGNVYVSMAHRRPRLIIEKALTLHGQHPARFLQCFMDIWEDPRYQQCASQAIKAISAFHNPPRSWLFYLELKARMNHIELPELSSYYEIPSPTPAELAKAITEVNAPIKGDGGGIPHSNHLASTLSPLCHPAVASNPDATSRTAYVQMARRLSPLLCFVSLLESSNTVSVRASVASLKPDFRQVFFSFPILYCWPFMELTVKGDSRALVLLFHFYRAARILLSSDESWWAHERSKKMEGLIAKELASRGLDVPTFGLDIGLNGGV